MRYISPAKVNTITTIFTPKQLTETIKKIDTGTMLDLHIGVIGYLMGMLCIKTYLRDNSTIDAPDDKPPLALLTHIKTIVDMNINHNNMSDYQKNNFLLVVTSVAVDWKKNIYWTIKNGKFLMFYGKYGANIKTNPNDILYELLYEQDRIDISHWDISNIDGTPSLFNCPLIMYYYKNEGIDINDVMKIENWDVSKIESMDSMFSHCATFNKPLHWNTRNVRNMESMFFECNEFNQPLNSWDVSNVTNMENMFMGCKKFNQPLDRWNVNNVTNMKSMFMECEKFNQPLNKWGKNMKKVTDMTEMFLGCFDFNQPLDQWNVSNVTNMSYMFYACEKFNQPLNPWNTKLLNVTNMNKMFMGCAIFNQPLDEWNVSNVICMNYMFYACKKFNQPLNSWGEKLKKVTDTSYMFMACTDFNQPLDKWELKCDTVEGMFTTAVSFNEKIPTILKQNANKKNWLAGTKLESESELKLKPVMTNPTMKRNKKTKKNNKKSKKSNQSRKNVTENDVVDIEDIDIEDTEIKEEPEEEEPEEEEPEEEPRKAIIEDDIQIETLEQKEQKGFRFIYDTFQKFYKNEKNLNPNKKPKTSYFYNNENELLASNNDKFIEIPVLNNNTTNKRLYVKYIQYLQEEHILFTILKSKNKVDYDDHYHFYLKDGIVGFHKTIQEPDKKPGEQKKTHLTCNFGDGTPFENYESFKRTICRNPGSTNMENVFTDENDLYYIYQIISRPFLQNQKAGKRRTRRRRRTRQRRRTRKSHYHYR
jgi:surface protein